MNPPPIRYPLPTLVGLALLGLALWRGADLARPAWDAVATRMKRLVEGPPVPSSDTPQVVAGPVIRRVLLLHGDTPAAARPDGPAAETIRHRGLFDVYDVWPLKGTPTHYRIGNRRAIGWVGAGDVLPWSTRLVVRPPSGSILLADKAGASEGRSFQVGSVSLPVVGWDADGVQLTAWADGKPWTEAAGTGWAARSSVPAGAWGVLLSREELLALMEEMLDDSADPARVAATRLRAVLGKLLDPTPLDPATVASAGVSLPPGVLARDDGSRGEKAARLSLLNERWTPEAAWGGFEFAVVPLSDLP